MNWQLLLKKLKEHGYTGDEKSLDAVKSYVDANFDGLEVNGKPVDLSDLHAKAFPRKAKMDLSGDVADAQAEELQQKVAALEAELLGKAKQDGRTKALDVKVGHDQIVNDPKGGFKSFGHFIQAVYRTGGTGERAFEPNDDSLLGKWAKAYAGKVREEVEWAAKNGLISKATLSTYSNEGTGVDGGFAVPPEFMAGIMKRIDAEDSIQARCSRATLSGNSLTATIDDTNPWDSSGGVQPYWLGEASTITQSKVALKQRDFKLRKIAVLTPLTDELAQDAGFMESYLARLAGEKIGYAVDDAILHGNGVTRPTGVVGHNGTVSVAKETSQVAATIVATNIQKMWMAALPANRRRSFWVANPDTQVQLQRMFVQGKTDAGTNVAAGSLVYMPANGLVGQPNDTLMGRPILYHQAAKTLGTVGDIILFDPESYLVCTKASGVEAASSMHIWFDQAVSALRFVYRVEGQPWWPSTVTAANGSQTYAAFVTLATRS